MQIPHRRRTAGSSHEAFDASIKSSLGPVVEQQLRAARIAHAYTSPQQGQAIDYLSDVPTWTKVDHVMQGVAALLDVQTAKAVHKLELPSLLGAEQRLIMKLAGTITATKDWLQKHKSDVRELWAKLNVMLMMKRIRRRSRKRLLTSTTSLTSWSSISKARVKIQTQIAVKVFS